MDADLVVLGCSFAGLEFLYRRVRRHGRFGPGVCVVVEPARVHTYLPLAHEVASGVARESDNTYDAAAFVTSIGAVWCPGTAVGVDPVRRTVTLDSGELIGFSRLVIAIGSVDSAPDWPNVFSAKRVDDAARVHAVLAPHHSVAIVGGGITGVEWAAELASRAKITLITDSDEVLPSFAPGVRRHARRRLAQLGVSIRTSEHVSSRPDYDYIIWAGGVRAHPLLQRDTDRIATIGDASPLSGRRAIDAIWQGAWLARHLDSQNYPGRREFFYGLSLGRAHSVILRGRWWIDTPLFVSFRRWLRAAYYARFTLLRHWYSLQHALDRRDDLARRARLR
jgi:NADH dehydrogenase FAD-containing subunit